MPRRRPRYWKLTDKTFSLFGTQWNVTYAHELIASREPANRAPDARFDIGPDLDRWLPDRETGEPIRDGSFVTGHIRINREHALSEATDLTQPVLLVCVNDCICPIDGWHRIFKARHEGLSSLPAYLLTTQEEKLVRR